MAIERSIKNLLLLVLAIIIVVILWNTIWFLGGLAVFAIVAYFLPVAKRQPLVSMPNNI